MEIEWADFDLVSLHTGENSQSTRGITLENITGLEVSRSAMLISPELKKALHTSLLSPMTAFKEHKAHTRMAV